MKFKKSKELMKLIDYEFDFAEIESNQPKPKKLFDDEVKTEIKTKARGGGYSQQMRYSIYNPNLAKFLLEYYTNEGDLILDPFMGRATRPLVTLFLNRRYFGYDTCKQTVDSNIQLIESKFPNKNFSNKFAWNCQHGSGIDIPHFKQGRKVFDAVFTCPPYYDSEKYSGEEGDLSHISYEEFDKQIDTLFANLYRLIKPSDYEKKIFHPLIFTVGTVRKGKHGIIDMDRIFQNIAIKHGFVLHDKIFSENNTPGAGFTFRRNYVSKFVCKNYETTLIFVKYE